MKREKFITSLPFEDIMPIDFLIVESEFSYSEAIEDVARSCGLSTKAYANGVEALRDLQSSPDGTLAKLTLIGIASPAEVMYHAAEADSRGQIYDEVLRQGVPPSSVYFLGYTGEVPSVIPREGAQILDMIETSVIFDLIGSLEKPK